MNLFINSFFISYAWRIVPRLNKIFSYSWRVVPRLNMLSFKIERTFQIVKKKINLVFDFSIKVLISKVDSFEW